MLNVPKNNISLNRLQLRCQRVKLPPTMDDRLVIDCWTPGSILLGLAN